MGLLQRIETMFARNQGAYYENGSALWLVRNNCLYNSSGYDSFNQYVEAELDIQRRHAYRLIEAYEIVQRLVDAERNSLNESDLKLCPMGHNFDPDNLDISLYPTADERVWSLKLLNQKCGVPLPINERQARALKPVEDDADILAVWKIACKEAEIEGVKITAARVQACVAQFLGVDDTLSGKTDTAAEVEKLSQMSLPFAAMIKDLESVIQAEASNGWQDTSKEAVIFKLKTLTSYVKNLKD